MTKTILLLLALCPVSVLGQTQLKDEPSQNTSGKPSAVIAVIKPNIQTDPITNVRNAKYVYVKSSSLLVGPSVIEEKLRKRSEFQQMGLMITRDAAAADLILEVHHDVFTMYVFTAVDPKTEVVIAGGKLSSLGGTVASKVAERFMKQLVKTRLGPGGD